MATTLAEHVSTQLRRAGFSVSSPELVAIRDHNNRVFAYGAALEAERRRLAERRAVLEAEQLEALKERLGDPAARRRLEVVR